MRMVGMSFFCKPVGSIFAYGLIVLIGTLLMCSDDAWGGWRLDGGRFRGSAHGDMSCQDCHDSVDSADSHPDPRNVNRKVSGTFEPDMCLECHDDVREQIEDGAEHGGQAAGDTHRLLNCVDCHNPHYEGAPEQGGGTEAVQFEGEDRQCMSCHEQGRKGASGQVARNREFCFTCHASGSSMPGWVPAIDTDQYALSPHAKTDCLTCHPQADRYEHDRQNTGDCRQCHLPHEETVAGDAHSQVSCEACHLNQVTAVRDAHSNLVVWRRSSMPGAISGLHDFSRPDGDGCARCHFNGNTVGAAAMILPAKSVLCMPCHPSTFSAGDTVSIISIVVAVAALLGMMSIWFSGSLVQTAGSGGYLKGALGGIANMLRTARLGPIFKAFVYDVLLQLRLYRRSKTRWTIHALIFWPFVIRFIWGVLALFASNFLKSWSWTWEMIDKNDPLSAFIFDFTGICLVAGIFLALIRGSAADRSRVPGLPSQDRLALGLLAGIVVVGFVLEGMRMAMTNAQGPAAYAFLGFALSRLFAGMTRLSEVYGYVWYLHAILTGAFVVYLPFSRMLHIIVAPVVLLMNAGKEAGQH